MSRPAPRKSSLSGQSIFTQPPAAEAPHEAPHCRIRTQRTRRGVPGTHGGAGGHADGIRQEAAKDFDLPAPGGLGTYPCRGACPTALRGVDDPDEVRQRSDPREGCASGGAVQRRQAVRSDRDRRTAGSRRMGE